MTKGDMRTNRRTAYRKLRRELREKYLLAHLAAYPARGSDDDETWSVRVPVGYVGELAVALHVSIDVLSDAAPPDVDAIMKHIHAMREAVKATDK